MNHIRYKFRPALLQASYIHGLCSTYHLSQVMVTRDYSPADAACQFICFDSEDNRLWNHLYIHKETRSVVWHQADIAHNSAWSPFYE